MHRSWTGQYWRYAEFKRHFSVAEKKKITHFQVPMSHCPLIRAVSQGRALLQSTKYPGLSENGSVSHVEDLASTPARFPKFSETLPNFDGFVRSYDRNENLPKARLWFAKSFSKSGHIVPELPDSPIKSYTNWHSDQRRTQKAQSPMRRSWTSQYCSNAECDRQFSIGEKIAPSSGNTCLSTFAHFLLARCRRGEHCYAGQYCPDFLKRAACQPRWIFSNWPVVQFVNCLDGTVRLLLCCNCIENACRIFHSVPTNPNHP